VTEEQQAAIRAELERVAASPGFSAAGRLAPFLRHLVEIALEGKPGRLKEAVLGIEFFGRPADYDPRTDPIVRVEARRLRARLEDYYQTAPPGPLRISLPKGGYVPAFDAAESTGVRHLTPAWRLAIAAGLLAVLSAAFWLAWRRERVPPRRWPSCRSPILAKTLRMSTLATDYRKSCGTPWGALKGSAWWRAA
jgi:hypothetical protein